MKTTELKAMLHWRDLGRMEYDAALELQMDARDALLQERSDDQTLFVVEHPPTITIGRNGTTDNVVAPAAQLDELGFVVRHVDRGGDVTYHGPGQLVVYPILHLAPWQNDVAGYVRMLEDVVMQALATVDIVGTRSDGYPGVWVGDRKISAIGARVMKRKSGEFVTSHGLALNVNTDLTHFQTIVPCGIADRGVTSIAAEVKEAVDWVTWQNKIRTAFADVFAAQVCSP